MSDDLTPAGSRLKKFFEERGPSDCFGGRTLRPHQQHLWDDMAAAVLDGPEREDRERNPAEVEAERHLALAMADEWTFMSATHESWLLKARSIRARIEHIINSERCKNNMADDDEITPTDESEVAELLSPLTEEDIEKIASWVNDWKNEFISLSELPETWVLSDRGVRIKMTREQHEADPAGGPTRPIVVEGHFVGMSVYEVGLDDDTGICQRVDVILMSGSSFPLRRDSLIEVDGQVVWAPEE